MLSRNWDKAKNKKRLGPESLNGLAYERLVISSVHGRCPKSSPFTTTMGAVCCRSQPIDFDGEVTLFHFRLLKVVGKGAFGKVCPAPSPTACPHPSWR